MCKFCEEYMNWEKALRPPKAKRFKDMQIKHYFRACISITTRNKYGKCDTVVGKDHYLRYCPECGRELRRKNK